MRIPTPLFPIAASLVLSVSPAFAGGHDESIDGDLSGSGGAPTPVSFDVGTNILKGTVVGGGVDTRDYLTFTLPAGTELLSMKLTQYVDTSTGGLGNTGAHGLHAGATAVNPSAAAGGQYMGVDHVSDWQVGSDILNALTFAAAGTGFSVPVGAGSYTYLIQQTGANDPTGYTIEVEIGCTSLASSTTYGAGKPGTAGVPTLTATAPPIVGGTSSLALGNIVAGASPTVLFVGFAPASLPFDGGTLLVTSSFTLPLPPVGPLNIPFNLPATSSLCNLNIFLQVMAVDPGAAGFNQTAQTAGLRLHLGS